MKSPNYQLWRKRMPEEKETDLSIEDIELDDGEKPIDRLRRDAPVMADFVEAYKDEMKAPSLGMIGPGWMPPKLEFTVEQFRIGTGELSDRIKEFLNSGWDIWQFCNTDQWLIVFFHRKVDKVDNPIDS